MSYDERIVSIYINVVVSLDIAAARDAVLTELEQIRRQLTVLRK